MILLLLSCVVNKTVLEDTSEPEEPEVYWNDLADILEPHMSNVPALGAARIHGGAVTDLGTLGFRSSGSDVGVTDWDKWHLGSCTKSMTANLVGTFVDDRSIQWESTLSELFPELTDMHPDFQTVTVEMLLSHHGGTWGSFGDHLDIFMPLYEEGDVVQQRMDVVKAVLSEAPESTPGSEFVYSNAGYMIVGAALERISEKSWEDLLQERIFTPLNMDSCGFGAQDPTGSLENPWGHDGMTPLNPVTEFGDNPVALGPAGTVHCSLLDWGDYIVEQLKSYRGEGSILSEPQQQKIFEVYGSDYAMGWTVVSRSWAGGEVFSHTGSNTINAAVVWAAPDLDEAYMVVSNTATNEVWLTMDQIVGEMIEMESPE